LILGRPTGQPVQARGGSAARTASDDGEVVMIIKSFSGSGLNGYINVKLHFFPDLTFLYGINGSGKTTVVRSIHALLTCSIAVLAETVYSSMDLLVEIDGRAISITAKRTDIEMEIAVDSLEPLTIMRFNADDDLPLWKQDEGRSEFYASQANLNASHPVVKAIDALPTPMYLGLERRAAEPIRRLVRPSLRDTRSSIFSTSLDTSLNEASSFAALAFRSAYVAESKLKDKLRNDLILTAFRFEDASRGFGSLRKVPKKSEARQPLSQSKNIVKVLQRIGLQQNEIETVELFFAQLSKIIDDLPDAQKGKQAPEVRGADIGKVVKYQFNKLQFDRAKQIVERVEEFSQEVVRIYKPIETYKQLMNEFFGASRKQVAVDVSGLSVLIEDVGPRDVTSMSSGEQQLIVLFTQLWFNPNAITSNVLIIDEPELSLHLRWQEMFVAALSKAHSGLQLILATHSPSIILDRDDKAIELAPNYA